MTRLRYNFIGGKIDDDPLTAIAISFGSASLAAFPSISTPDYVALILDPDGVNGAPEIVWVTTHATSATSATILRGQESTVARAHPNDTFWIHGPTTLDFILSEVAAKIYLANNFQ